MSTRIVTFGLALLQGIVLWWLFDAARDKAWPATDPAWLVALLAPAILVPPLVYLQLGLARLRAVLLISCAAGLVLAGLGWHYGAQVVSLPARYGGNYDESAYAFALAVIVLCFHALPFLQSALETGRVRPQYPRLFVFAWRNALQVVLAAIFCGVLWALLGLWMQLFDMIGIDFFKRLFTDSRVALPLTTVAFAVAIGLAGSVERLQQALRQHLLGLFKWLAVLAMLILTLFTLALLAKSPELFGAGRRAVSATWLLWLLVFCVYLLNAAYQDGSLAAPYPRPVGAALRFVSPLLVVVALLAIYALGVRIDAYGFTVARLWALLVAVLLLVYSVGYGVAAFRPGAWMASMGGVNVVAAITLIAALTLMLTPALSPYRIAAASQAARILDGTPSSDKGSAYTALAFDAGGYGRRQLAELAKLQAHPDAARIRTRAAAALASENRYAGSKVEAQELTLVAFPAGRSIDSELRAAIASAGPVRYGEGACVPESGGCPVLFVDLNGDGVDEAVAFTDNLTLVLVREGNVWRQRSMHGSEPMRAAAFERLRAGDYRVVAPQWQSLAIGSDTLTVLPW